MSEARVYFILSHCTRTGLILQVCSYLDFTSYSENYYAWFYWLGNLEVQFFLEPQLKSTLMMCRLRYTSEIWSVLTYHRKQLKHCRVCGYNVLVFICPHYGFDSHIAGIELVMDDVRSQNAQQCVVIMRTNSNIFYGKVSEWFMVTVLKTVAQRCAVGSNPILSAIGLQCSGNTIGSKPINKSSILLRPANLYMERWQSGLLHFPAKEEWRYISTVGSNPTLSAKYDSIAQVDRAMVS